MPRYVSLHALGCLPKPAFAALCAKLFASPQMRRALAGQIGEKLLVEFEAADAAGAQGWLRDNKLTPLWLLRIDYESTDGTVREL
jgi:hypothetical protein